MLAELQQKFFETFEIPKVYKTSINTGDLDLNYVEIQAPTLEKLYEEAQFDLDTPIFFSWFKRSKRWSEEYPQITDRQYLELICILSTYMNEIDNIQLITDNSNHNSIYRTHYEKIGTKPIIIDWHKLDSQIISKIDVFESLDEIENQDNYLIFERHNK